MKWNLEGVANIVVLVGAINWGLTALGFNLVELLAGSMPILVNIIYGVVGIAGVWLLLKMIGLME